MAEEVETFEGGDAGGSLTIPSGANEIKKGSYCVIKGFPCKVDTVTTSKTGKHGHAKAKIIGKDIFTDKKYELNTPTSHTVEVPIVKTVDYRVFDIDDRQLSVLDEDGEVHEEFDIPDNDTGKDLVERWENEFKDLGTDAKEFLCVTVTSAMGTEQITKVDKKVDTSSA